MLVSVAMLSVVVYALPAMFPVWYGEERWTLGKELLSTLLLCVLVVLGNWIYTALIFGIPLNLHLLCICLLCTYLFALGKTMVKNMAAGGVRADRCGGASGGRSE